MTLCTLPTVGCRQQIRERRSGRPPSGKRLQITRDHMPAKVRSAFRRSLDPCDNSNDSGLGFDHHLDHQHHSTVIPSTERVTWNNDNLKSEPKRPRMDIKLENEDINDGYCFPEAIRSCKENTSLVRTAPSGSIPPLSINNNQTSQSGRVVPRCIPLSNRQTSSGPVALTTQFSSTSRYMDVSLTIVKQPEQQHRARYQTEGSRGAVKDREGSGFPIVQLTGYYQPTTLQVFIGTDVGKVSPHMFYQACKVSGKNSTPCIEKKIDGTCVIELQLDPSKEMSATCDCVGILKERNVDVEHRFPDQLGNRSKKKSTRCRMIFRTTLTHDDGTLETLQVCSQPIVCTQPPGIPEICKKSLTSCPASGGLELFVLGKNFLKDTKVFFQQIDDDRHIRWEQAVVPDKEYLQQTHFVCVVPPYRRPDITEPITVRLCVVSSGKTSESHQFVYTPINGAIPSGHVESVSPLPPTHIPTTPTIQSTQPQFFNKIWSLNKREQDLGMMPPPETNLMPLTRRPSINLLTNGNDNSPPSLHSHQLKQEYIDENSQNSIIDQIDVVHERFRHISESSLDVNHDSNLSMINDNSIDMINDIDETTTRRNRQMQSLCDNSLEVSLNSRITTSTPNVSVDELKVIDLRMKMPIGTVADLVHSNAPSMATLHSFGVTEASTLPPQSAQSVENFLTNIEKTQKNIPQNEFQQKLLSPPVINRLLTTTTPSTVTEEPVFLSSTNRNLLTSTQQNEVAMHIMAKSEAAAIAEQQRTVTAAEKLDDLVNSTVDTHIGSPKTTQIDSIITRDVMLNSQATLVVPTITTSQQQDLSATSTTDAILNSQISPTQILTTNEPEKAVILKAAVDFLETQKKISELDHLSTTNEIINSEFVSNQLTTTAETFVSNQFNDTTVDSLVQNQLNSPTTVDNFVSTQFNGSTANLVQNQFNGASATNVDSLVQSQFNGATTSTVDSCLVSNQFVPAATSPVDNKTDFVIPVPVKEITGVVTPQQEKKNEDRMIPQAFTALTENELINLINPSCFDQV